MDPRYWTPDADAWWGGGSLPHHLGLLYADREAKIVTRESKAVDQPLECFFRVRCHGGIVSEEDLPDGNVPDLGFGSEPGCRVYHRNVCVGRSRSHCL